MLTIEYNTTRYCNSPLNGSRRTSIDLEFFCVDLMRRKKSNLDRFMIMMEVRTPAWNIIFENKGPKIQNMTCSIGFSQNMSSWNMIIKALLDMSKLLTIVHTLYALIILI